ncbi:toll/interleukin-1 receptor domain-containing protein [Actinokineospora sp. NPDC004072]
MRVFVNYRTGDGEHIALLVSRFLSARLGAENVFFASRSIPAGAEFDRELLRNVWRSDALVAVIGARWLAARDRLDDPHDWVRREIAEALSHQVTVIPLLVDAVPRPAAADLPEPLAGLAKCQGIRLHVPDADAGLERLAAALGAPAAAPANAPVRGGGIGSITATTVTALTDAQGPVHIGDRITFHRPHSGTHREPR